MAPQRVTGRELAFSWVLLLQLRYLNGCLPRTSRILAASEKVAGIASFISATSRLNSAWRSGPLSSMFYASASAFWVLLDQIMMGAWRVDQQAARDAHPAQDHCPEMGGRQQTDRR